MQRTIPQLLTTALCASVIAACGGGSGGGGSALNEDEQAAVAAFGAKLFASTGAGFVDQGSPDDDQQAALATKQQNTCNESGSLNESGPTNENVGSPFTGDGSLAVRTFTADNCRNSFSNGFSSSSRIDGEFKQGSAEDGAVAYFRASDLNGDPDTGDPYITESSSSGDGFSNQFSSSMRALMHVCDGCTSPANGGVFELDAYLEADFNFGGESFSLTYGRDSSDRLSLVEMDSGGGTRTVEINGIQGFDNGRGCAFRADYTTVSPLVFENAGTDNEQITAGELNLESNGTTTNVQFQSDGSALINGQPFNEEDFAALAERCDFEFDTESAPR